MKPFRFPPAFLDPSIHSSSDAKLMSDPVFRADDRYYNTREEAFDRAMEKSVRYVEVSTKMDILDRNLFKK